MGEGEVHKAVLFADVVGSTALYRELGNERAERLIGLALERGGAIARQHAGRVVKTIGDCIFCEFPDANAAASAALEIQRISRVPLDGTDAVRFRIGFTAGATVSRGGDLYGDAVNIAARICDLAKSEQILTTEEAAAYLEPSLQAASRFFDRAPVKGVAQPVGIVQLLWERREATQMSRLSSQMSTVAFALELSFGQETRRLNPPQMPLSLGRGSDCDWVIEEPGASRRHARIEYRRGKFVLVDESTNGTYVQPQGTAREHAVYLRNEAFTLLGAGVITLGKRPADETRMIRYAVS